MQNAPVTIQAEPISPPDEPRHELISNPLDNDPIVFQQALDRRKQNRTAMMQWVGAALVEGTDFGRIHTTKRDNCDDRGPPRCTFASNPWHWSKPSLFKPGAEKICGMLGVTPTFPTLADYEKAVLEGRAIEQIILRCHLTLANGRIVSDGVGARSVAYDKGDLNKALKMAAKSAHIDATLRMAGLSEVFTQDVEDMKLGDPAPAPGTATSPPPPAPVQDDSVVPRGKHKGKKWIEVSEEYLQWAVTGEGCPQDLKNACQRELDRRDAKRTSEISPEDDIKF